MGSLETIRLTVRGILGIEQAVGAALRCRGDDRTGILEEESDTAPEGLWDTLLCAWKVGEPRSAILRGIAFEACISRRL